MTKVIIASGGNTDSFYEQTLQYLHDKYIVSKYAASSVTEADMREAEINDNMIASGGAYNGTPIGKQVVSFP